MTGLDSTSNTPLAPSSDLHSYLQFARLESLSQWSHWLLLLLVCAAVASFAVIIYRRDSHWLSRAVSWLLMILRFSALVGLLIFFLQLERRTERKLTKTSRAVLLIDTSQSMGLSDGNQQSLGSTATETRLEQMIQTLKDGTLLPELRKQHDCVVYRFDEEERPTEIATFAKIPSADSDSEATASQLAADETRVARRWYTAGLAIVLLAAGLLTIHFSFWLRSTSLSGENWLLLGAVVLLIVGLVTTSVANLRFTNIPISVVLGRTGMVSQNANVAQDPVAAPFRDPEVDWATELRPQGLETRLGDAIRAIVQKERGGPLAGIVVYSDGNQNAGHQCDDATRLAADAAVAIHTVGAGSDQLPINIKIVDVEAPPRVYPGDAFSISVQVQASGMEGRTVPVQIRAIDPRTKTGNENLGDVGRNSPPLDELLMLVGPSGEMQDVTFELDPDFQGRQQFIISVVAPAEDFNPDDNQQSVTVEITEGKTKVLLIAGGPTREYRFLRNLSYRDRNTSVDVLLQLPVLAQSQEGDTVLEDFPSTEAELFDYDCIVAFDPDWEALTQQQANLLESWVAQQAGGFIVVAGPVYTPVWTTLRKTPPALDVIRGLYPVTFYSRGTARLARRTMTAESASPIEFTDDGRNARFLWLEDSLSENAKTWARFEGVYSSFPIQNAKSGAVVYARHGDQQGGLSERIAGGGGGGRDAEGSVFMASQFYGSGRVFYLASGEMWRLRAIDEKYFEAFYTKLLRYVSEGRLLRDSNRGSLLVDKNRCMLGDTVTVRAFLADDQRKPLAIPEVEAVVVGPNRESRPLTLRLVQDSPRPGTYAGQFVVLSEGEHQILLPIPQSIEMETLSAQVRVRAPDREVQHPQRNDALLSTIAQSTGGVYFPQLTMALDGGDHGLASVLLPQDQETYLPGSPDRAFQQKLMSWLLLLICGALSCEWLIRRLNKLA